VIYYCELTSPTQVTIDNPCELDEIYDAITYGKSASIIRMLFNYLGEPTFQKGLRIYLDKHKYSNAETKDLWQCLGEASGIVMIFPIKHLKNYRKLTFQGCEWLDVLLD
jgi:aminopeptidase N